MPHKHSTHYCVDHNQSLKELQDVCVMDHIDGPSTPKKRKSWVALFGHRTAISLFARVS